MDKTSYVVRDGAPERVAGRKVKPGDRLELTETEAFYDRDMGRIEPAELAPLSGSDPDGED